MTQKKLERFGRYLILDHLVDGGMAKICRARFLGDTASKICAIKMVQPQYSQDESYKTMFMDEVKVTFGLLHPNIVQTYDYGYHNNQLYVAMEYCDGRNLKEYLDKLKERKFVFPVEISVYIITQVCQALHYAHTLSDKMTGKDMKIIHRDISPHNIMLTYDGSIKVIDFGIAKAETNSEATQAGTIKGKLSYLAPEYLDGKVLDARYDMFAVGITLWEMLCSRKLFKANNDLAVLKMIQECNIKAPSSINPNVPKELDEIVLKALAKDRNKRFEDMDKLNRALMKFLYSHYPDFNATDLSYFAKELFKEDIQKDKEKLFAFGKIDLAPYIDEIKREGAMQMGSSSSTTSVEVKSDDMTASAQKAAVFDFGFDGKEEKFTSGGTRVVNKKDLLANKTSKIARPGSESASGDGLALDGAVKKRVSRSKMGNSDEKTKLGLTGTKRVSKNSSTRTNVTQSLPISKSGGHTSKIITGLAIAGALAGFVYIKKPELIDKILGNKQKEVREPSSNTQAKNIDKNSETETHTATSEGVLFVRNYDKYKQKIYINGVAKDANVLGDVKGLPLGQELVLRVEQQGYRHFIYKFTLNSDSPRLSIDIPEQPMVAYGHLMTARNCASGKLIFNLFGESRTELMPSKDKTSIAFPLKISDDGEVTATTYEIFFEKAGESFQRKISFTLNFENDSIDFCNIYYATVQNNN